MITVFSVDNSAMCKKFITTPPPPPLPFRKANDYSRTECLLLLLLLAECEMHSPAINGFSMLNIDTFVKLPAADRIVYMCIYVYRFVYIGM